MSPNQEEHLRRILTDFNATWLGEGDINAGSNLLVVKAITLTMTALS